MGMQWNFSEDRPIYAQIIEQMKEFIVSGAVKPGDKLPSVRELAGDAGVNPNTMQRAMAELESTGLVYSQRTSGRFITEREELVQSARLELAREKTGTFLKSMEQLGFSRAQTADFMKDYKEDDGI